MPFLLSFLWHPIILLTGAMLGSWRGGLAILVCLAEGAVALHFFVPGGLVATFPIVGPLGGYILSWPLAAYSTGLLYKRCLNRRFRTSFLAMLPGSALIFVLLISWFLSWTVLTKAYVIDPIEQWLVLAAVQTVVPSLLAAIALTALWRIPRLKQHSFV